MLEVQPAVCESDTHDQFLRRVSIVFPVVGTWSRVERLVFNQLMSRLIFKYGYASINHAMLNECRDEMLQAVQRCANK